MSEHKETTGEGFTRGGIGFIGGMLFFGAVWLAKLKVLQVLEGSKAVQKEI